MIFLEKIISGGQTGVDRAALDVALEIGIPCGGWCPRGRRAEDGSIPERYPLKEALSSDYPVRTRKNVEDSDGTLILTRGRLRGGTALTLRLAQELGKPYFLADLSKNWEVEEISKWEQTFKIRVLNVAGPREGEATGIYEQARAFLRRLLESWGKT